MLHALLQYRIYQLIVCFIFSIPILCKLQTFKEQPRNLVDCSMRNNFCACTCNKNLRRKKLSVVLLDIQRHSDISLAQIHKPNDIEDLLHIQQYYWVANCWACGDKVFQYLNKIWAAATLWQSLSTSGHGGLWLTNCAQQQISNSGVK